MMKMVPELPDPSALSYTIVLKVSLWDRVRVAAIQKGFVDGALWMREHLVTFHRDGDK